MKKLIYTIVLGSIFLFNINSVESAVQAPIKPAQKSQAVAYLNVSPVAVVNNPANYLNKNITFNAEIVAFTSLGLDYKPAYRDPAKYIGVLIRRPDVVDHVIPLSEMKIFITREVAEKNMDVDAGDKVKFSGKVFSTALGDPWVDASTFVVLEKKQETKK